MSTTAKTMQKRAPCLLVFCPLAARIAAILRARTGLIEMIAFAPPEAIHSIAALLYLAPEAAKSDVEIADLIEQSDLRELPNKAIPECPPRLYRAPATAGNMSARGTVEGLHHPWMTGNAGAMPDRPFRVVDELIRRVQRVAAERPDPIHVLAQMISMIGESEADPYAVLGVLVEGASHTVIRHIPAERQADTAATLVQLLEERLKAHGLTGGDR